jgi:SAM-dependent methyltransferase
MKILDLGCGHNKTPGAIGIDLVPGSQADIVYDLDLYPWPLADDSFERVVCKHIAEHVAGLVQFMGEIHRVSRAGAVVEVVTPHFSNRYSFTDPTHVRHLAWRSFDYFTGGSAATAPTFWERALELRHPIPGFHSRTRFLLRSRFLDFGRPFRWLGIQWLANRFPDFYELYLAFIFPARDLYFVLQVVK